MTAPHQNLLSASVATVEPDDGTDPDFNRNVLLLHGDGSNGGQNETFVDSSSSGKSMAANAGTPNQGSFGPFCVPDGYWSVFYDASNSNNTVPNSTNTDVGSFTEDYTLECFFNVSIPSSAAFKCIFGQSTGSSAARWFVGVDMGANGLASAGKIGLYNSAGGGVDASFTYVVHQWYHLAIVYTHSNTTTKVYIDGSEKLSMSSNLVDNSGALTWGTTGHTTGDLTGYISNVRLVKGTAITSVPTEPLTAVSGTTLLANQSNRFLDNSSNGLTVTVNGTPKVQPFYPFEPDAAYSDSTNGGSFHNDVSAVGNEGVVTSSTSSDFAFGTGDFTTEAWIYGLTTNVTQQAIYGNRSSATNTIYCLHYFGTANKLNWNTGLSVLATSTIACETFCWNHVAVTKASGTSRMFINGAIGVTWSDTADYSYVGVFKVGFDVYAGDFNGFITDVRVVKGTALYTSAFTPPTAPLTTTSQSATASEVKLLLSFTNGEIIDSTAKQILSPMTTDTQIDTSVKKFGTGSIEVDGGDVLKVADSTAPFIRTGPFTVEFFIYFNGNPNSGGTNARATIVKSTGGSMILRRYDGEWEAGSGGTPQIQVAQSISNTTWYHVAMTRDTSNNLRLFINGTQQGSTATSFTTDFTDNSFFFGNSSNAGGTTEALTGFMDEIRVTLVARYTANFTAPTKAFSNI